MKGLETPPFCTRNSNISLEVKPVVVTKGEDGKWLMTSSKISSLCSMSLPLKTSTSLESLVERAVFSQFDIF